MKCVTDTPCHHGWYLLDSCFLTLIVSIRKHICLCLVLGWWLYADDENASSEQAFPHHRRLLRHIPHWTTAFPFTRRFGRPLHKACHLPARHREVVFNQTICSSSATTWQQRRCRQHWDKRHRSTASRQHLWHVVLALEISRHTGWVKPEASWFGEISAFSF